MRWKAAWLGLVLCAGCGSSDPKIFVIRLVDEFASAKVENAASAAPELTRTEWSFADGAAAGGRRSTGVSGLGVREGRLVGRTTTRFPIVQLDRAAGLEIEDLLQEVVVRMRASKGASLSVAFDDSDTPDLPKRAGRGQLFPWPLTTPIVAGADLRTYRISAATSAQTSFEAKTTRHVLLSPTDAEGADFEVESVRLVFRKEHLASIASGVSWQGLSEIYRESIVSRSPEKLRFDLRLPQHPFLDLAIGTLENGPLTFRIAAGPITFERTLTTPNRWEEVAVDLGDVAGMEVPLTLELDSEHPGAIGFWGAPAVRDRLPRPRAAGAGTSPPRGVILFLLDTTRRDHSNAYGYDRETTPTVSRLASEGVEFRDAIAQGAWTKVSVPSILTSTYPTSNGIYELNDRMPASGVTLAEAFREAGYATWAASSVQFTGRASNMHQGVEVLHEEESLGLPKSRPGEKSARPFVDRLLPWLEAHKDVPFYAMVHAMDAHSDYEPYQPYDTLWGEPDVSKKHKDWVERVKPFIESNFMKSMGLPTEKELERAGIDAREFVRLELAWYDGSIRAADTELSRIVEKLRELGLEKDTLVVFLSDHGEEFLDHGGSFHEENVYGELENVPLVMRWPRGIPAGLVVDETIQLLDVAPTILDLAGVAIPDKMQGQSLKPLLSSDASKRWRSHPAISEWRKRTDQLGTRIVDAFGIIDGGWKLVHNVDRPADVPEFELYDHKNDPLDQKNVAAEHPDIVERLAQELDAWHNWALEHKLPSNGEATEGMSAAQLERLRSLGYVK